MNRSRQWIVAALLVLVTTVSLATPQPLRAAPPTPTLPPANIEPALLKAAIQAKGSPVRFIVHLAAQADLATAAAAPPPPGLGAATARQARVASVVSALRETASRTQVALLRDLSNRQAAGQVQRYASLWVTNAVAVTADSDTLFAVASRPEVRLVTLDRWRQWVASPSADRAATQTPATTVEWNIQRIRADMAWAALGLDGSGVVVANVDTGVDWQHPALQSQYRGYDPHGPASHAGNWYDATDDGYLYPADAHGHGTHTMGTMVGAGGIGVAPGARWIAAKAFDSSGYAYDSWIHAAFQWILAPAGDPGRAPDVVNNSWGSDNPYDETFAPDLQALAAAGIFTVFSNGNQGPLPATVTSPASLPGVFSVGAIDAQDLAAIFSSRGPSPWGELKPAIAAPGVSIRSSTPGGAYQSWQGTSMAAPHASGTAALLLQARPDLTITQTAYALTSTAVPLRTTISDTVPNNTFGWGRLDALAAALSVASLGSLSGTVTSVSGHPVGNASVTALAEVSSLTATATSDADGRYNLPLAAGPYTVTANAFGYTASTPVRDIILTGTITIRNFTLAPVATGTLTGRVLDAVSGEPLSATVVISGTGLSVSTAPATGAYSITLPTGVYALRASSWGHRLASVTDIPISAGDVTTVDVALDPGPNVLLVDSGAWYNDSHAAAYQRALDALGYLYAVRPITYTGHPVTTTELLPYDVVIWSCPQDSPGLMLADVPLAEYLRQGGRLLISGQDIAYWDGGGSMTFYSPFLERYLHATFLADQAASTSLSGIVAEPLAGITLTLNTPDSDANQRTPDVVAPHDAQAAPVMAYDSAQDAGLRADVCLPYRVLYLSFGLEGAGPQSNRQALLDRGIAWLMADRPQHEVSVSPAHQEHVHTAPGEVSGTVTLWNTGLATDSYSLALSSSPWPAALWDASFQRMITSPVIISSCQVLTAGVAVQVPYDAPRNTTTPLSLTAVSATDPAVSRTVSFVTKTPASLLLVDDDRFYDVEAPYEAALAALRRTYDLWEPHIHPDGSSGTPNLADLQMYPAVVWFTGYDRFEPLTPADEAALTGYLQAGGRLFLSSQDTLYVSGLTDFSANYLGVLTYTNDITAVTETGVPGNPIGGGLGPYTPTVPYHQWPDIVTPTIQAGAAFLNPDGQPTSLTLDGGTFRSVFFTFPFEGLPSDAGTEIMRRILAWFGPLRASTFVADKAAAQPGDTLSYALVLENPGTVTVTVHMTNTLPLGLAAPAIGLHGATYSQPDHAVLWSGEIPPGVQVTVTYQATLQPAFRGSLSNQALLQVSDGDVFTLTARTLVPYSFYLPLVFR